MGQRGPKPRPTHLKVVAGEQESRINRDEPLPTEGEVVAPEGMSEAARAIWDELAPDLIDKGCLTPWDVYTFEAFCQAVALYRECRDLLYEGQSEYGRFVERGAAGGVIKSPYHQMMRDHVETMAKLGSRFGFTPGDRANLRLDASDNGPAQGAERLLS
ncbi:phage terminase small subunit P27 family [Mycobacterium colombiense]|uniref:Phage terminase small subunit P27 family n=1 Tax=Mycobacterium colombiense TaxID=339268 RepID=A0A329MBZ0_9MYCO|nr:phage terminase small subunit P27 family [Mycobacterium colombiense]